MALGGTSFSVEGIILPQREQVERSRLPDFSTIDARKAQPQNAVGETPAAPDDAFGAQVILKEKPQQRDFEVFSETAVFHTSNVALARENAKGDNFLNATIGLGWRHSFTDRLSLAISGRYSVFRYNRYGILDFQSADASMSLGIKLPAKWELAVGYGFTQLTTGSNQSEFYNEHAINVGLQRVFALNDANFLIAGFGPSWTWAEPKTSQRDRYAAYLGWHWRVTDRISTDLLYRYSHFVYRESGTGRRDHNQTLSLSIRYNLTDWLALTASGYAAWNRSNQSAFDFDAWNLGGSVGLNARF